MADKSTLRIALNEGVRKGGKTITEQQLSTAVESLSQKTRVTRSDLEALGEIVTKDRQVFAATDIDDINDILWNLKGGK